MFKRLTLAAAALFAVFVFAPRSADAGWCEWWARWMHRQCVNMCIDETDPDFVGPPICLQICWDGYQDLLDWCGGDASLHGTEEGDEESAVLLASGGVGCEEPNQSYFEWDLVLPTLELGG